MIFSFSDAAFVKPAWLINSRPYLLAYYATVRNERDLKRRGRLYVLLDRLF